jgi:hypothetical protein
MLFIEPLPMFQLCLISNGPTVLVVTSYIEIGVDVLADVVRGLIHLLNGITVVALASLGA